MLLDAFCLAHVYLIGIDLDQIGAGKQRVLCMQSHGMFRLIIDAARTDLLGVLGKPEHLMRQLRNVVHDDFTGAAYQTHRSHAETCASPDIVEFDHGTFSLVEIGRESRRERVCQYVYISVVAVSYKK